MCMFSNELPCYTQAQHGSLFVCISAFVEHDKHHCDTLGVALQAVSIHKWQVTAVRSEQLSMN